MRSLTIECALLHKQSGGTEREAQLHAEKDEMQREVARGKAKVDYLNVVLEQVCVCVCVCVCVYMLICMYTKMKVDDLSVFKTLQQVCALVCMYVYAYIHLHSVCMCMHTYICTPPVKYVCMCMHTSICTPFVNNRPGE